MSNTKKIKTNTRKSNKSGLNLNVINSANEKQFTTKTIVIPVDGKDYEVEISQVFRTTKIEKMINSLVKSENLSKFSSFDESIKLSYYMFLIIREFTNLDIPDNLSIEEEINLISNLIDLGIFEAIMKEIPEDQIAKVNDYLQKFNMNLNKVLDEMNEGKDVGDVEDFSFNENIIVSDDEVNDEIEVNKSGGQSE